MRISDAELDYWGDFYCAYDIRRYMPFSAFIHAPREHIKRIFNSTHRPLLVKQRAVSEKAQREMERLGRYDLIERLQSEPPASKKRVRRIRGSQIIPWPGKSNRGVS